MNKTRLGKIIQYIVYSHLILIYKLQSYLIKSYKMIPFTVKKTQKYRTYINTLTKNKNTELILTL